MRVCRMIGPRAAANVHYDDHDDDGCGREYVVLVGMEVVMMMKMMVGDERPAVTVVVVDDDRKAHGCTHMIVTRAPPQHRH